MNTVLVLHPKWLKILTNSKHRVLVQASAGEKIGYPDASYKEAGAEIVPSAEEVIKQK